VVASHLYEKKKQNKIDFIHIEKSVINWNQLWSSNTNKLLREWRSDFF
jgi:hypothetical protein